MIKDLSARTLAGYTWSMLYDQTLALGRSFCSASQEYNRQNIDFCEHIITLHRCMENHAYEMEAQDAFRWLYVAAHQYYVRHGLSVVAHKKFTDMLVNADYDVSYGKELYDNLYWLFNDKCFVSPTHGAVLWNVFLQAGTEKEAKPNLSAFMTFPFLYKAMPVWYRKDIEPVEPFRREAVFMALSVILGNFCQK